jgi:hypothetical protein
MAIACFLFVTFPPLPPLPDLRVSFFLRRMALATVLPAALPYLLRPEDLREYEFFFVGINAPNCFIVGFRTRDFPRRSLRCLPYVVLLQNML